MWYVIIYTNGITVLGYCVYRLVSRVNILLQGNVQRVTPTSPMYGESLILSLCVNFIHVENCWIIICYFE